MGDCHDCHCHGHSLVMYGHCHCHCLGHIFVLPSLLGIALAVIELSHERGQEYGVSETKQVLIVTLTLTLHPYPSPAP